MESISSKEEGQDEQTTVSEWSEMALPGFRFHPTEEELVGYYLRRMVQGRRNSVELIASLDLYQYDPWELPAMAFMGEKEWFFFCPRDKKYPNGARPNRVTGSGYWKATGTDRPVRCSGDSRCIGLKKTLVFYTGRAPRGNKTEWIMNEYRMPKPAEQSISLTSGVNSFNYSFSTCDNFVIKNDVALCRIYRKSSSALNSLSFISALAARDLEQRTLSSRMMSRFENNQPAAAAAAHEQQQQQHHHYQHIQRLQLLAPPPSIVNVRFSSSDIPNMASLQSSAPPSDNVSAQQSTTKTTAGLVTNSRHAQLVEAESQRQQQQLLDGGAAAAAGRGSYDHGVVPSIIECTTTSDEASRQLQIALRTAMAKFDGVGSSATLNFEDGVSTEVGSGTVRRRFRTRQVQDATVAAACRSTDAMRSPSPEVAAATTTTHHEYFSHPRYSCSQDISVATPLLRRSSSSDTVAAVSAFTPMKNDRSSCCSSPIISIPSSFCSDHHVSSSPSTTATTATTTQLCVEGARADPSAIVLHTINNNSTSHISASPSTQFEDEVQSLVDACSIAPLTNTFSLKRSRFTRVQQLVENFPLAKMPSVAQYWRQPAASASDSAVAAGASQLNTFDTLSGLAFQYLT